MAKCIIVASSSDVCAAIQWYLGKQLGWELSCAATYREGLEQALSSRDSLLILQLQSPVYEVQDMMTDLQTAVHCPAVLLYKILPENEILYSISDPEFTPTVKELEKGFLAAFQSSFTCKKVYFRSTVWHGDVERFAAKAGREEALKEIIRGCTAEELQLHQRQYKLDFKGKGYYLYFWDLQMIEYTEHRAYKDIYNFLGHDMELECKAAIDIFNGGEVFYINLLQLCVVINELPINSQAVRSARMNEMLQMLAKATGCKTAMRYLSKFLPNLSDLRDGYEDYMEKKALVFFMREQDILRSELLERKHKPTTLAEVQTILNDITKYLRYDIENPKLLEKLRILYIDILKPAMSFTMYYFSTAIICAELSRLQDTFDERQLTSNLNPNMIMFSSIEEQYKNMLQMVRNVQVQLASKHKTKRTLLLKALDYIEENYNQGITVSDIADNLYVSGVYLSQIFNNELHMSVIQYLIRFRIARAKILLEETDELIYSIAEKVGFRDARHFSKTFKRIVGVTPVEYRRNYMKETQLPND